MSAVPTQRRIAEPAVAKPAGGEAVAHWAQRLLKWKAGAGSYLPEASSPAEGHGGGLAAELSGGGSSGVVVAVREADSTQGAAGLELHGVAVR